MHAKAWQGRRILGRLLLKLVGPDLFSAQPGRGVVRERDGGEMKHLRPLRKKEARESGLGHSSCQTARDTHKGRVDCLAPKREGYSER